MILASCLLTVFLRLRTSRRISETDILPPLGVVDTLGVAFCFLFFATGSDGFLLWALGAGGSEGVVAGGCLFGKGKATIYLNTKSNV